MKRGRRLILAGLVHLGLGATIAGAQLRLEGNVVASDPPMVRVVARNAGAAAVVDATPTMLFEHRSYDGARATIDPGQEHEWRLSLPPPPTSGTFPASVRMAWRDAAGARRSAPFVVLVATPDAPPGSIALTWALEPAAPVAHTRLTLENRGTRPVAGRVAIVLPGEFATEPESQPVAVAANAAATVPLAIESRDAAPGTYPLYAVFTYTDGGHSHATLAGADLMVEPVRRDARAIPLAIGCTALVLVSGLLVIALRASRRPPR